MTDQSISVDDFILFCERSADGLRESIARAGDDLVNERPQLTGGNSPFALVAHVVGACRFWVEHILLGEPTNRDRDAEFTARGTTSDASLLIDEWLESLRTRADRIGAAATVQGTPSTQRPLHGPWTKGAVLLHVYEELAQHLGHLEVTVDVLLAERQH